MTRKIFQRNHESWLGYCIRFTWGFICDAFPWFIGLVLVLIIAGELAYSISI